MNLVKELSVPLRNKSERKYQSDPWNLIVITGTIVAASLTTQAAALITFGKWGLRNNQPSQGGGILAPATAARRLAGVYPASDPPT